MFCPKCGSELSNGSKFCGKCGAAIPHANAHNIITKPAKRKPLLPIILGSLVCVLLAAVCYIKIKPVLTQKHREDNLLYLSNGTYEFLSNPDAEQSVSLDASFGYPFSDYGYGGDDLVKFSPDGKYIYFYADVQDYNTDGSWHQGNLFRAEYSDLINSPKKEPQITEVAHDIIISDWDSNEYLSFLANGTIIYQTSDKSLYAFDGSKTIKIAENITDYFTDNVEYLIYEIKDGINAYGYNTSSVYGVLLDHLEDSIPLASQVDRCFHFITRSGNIHYQKYYTDSDESMRLSDLYTVGFDQEAQKVFSNCSWIDYDENYCLVQNGRSIPLYDCVQDTDSDTSDMEQLREELKNRKLDLYTAYYIDEENTEKIADDILYSSEVLFNTSSEIPGNLAYITAEQATQNKPLSINIFSEYEDAITDPLIFSEDICLMNGCIYDSQQHRTYQLSEEAKAGYMDIDYKTVSFFKDNVYLLVPRTSKVYSVDLYTAKIDADGMVGKFDKLIDNYTDAAISEEEDPESVYYLRLVKETDDFYYGDLNFYNHGTTTCLAKNILDDDTILCSDGSILAYTDYDDTYGYELTMFSPEGEQAIIAQHVTAFAPTDSGTILYISDHDLYCYDGIRKLIKSNVDYFWTPDTENSFQLFY